MNAGKRPVRTCVACRISGDKKDLLRVVKSASGELSIDETGKKPGRGAYVCRSEKCVTVAVKKKSFERALRTAVPAEFIEQIRESVQESENSKPVGDREEL